MAKKITVTIDGRTHTARTSDTDVALERAERALLPAGLFLYRGNDCWRYASNCRGGGVNLHGYATVEIEFSPEARAEADALHDRVYADLTAAADRARAEDEDAREREARRLSLSLGIPLADARWRVEI